MAGYLSIDTEATGLEADTRLIQLAFVPVDLKNRRVAEELGIETLVKCPSFEELKPKLSSWVIENNEKLIRDAHEKGVAAESLPDLIRRYLSSPGVKAIFGSERPVFLGKSLSALDLPLLTRYLGKDFMDKHFHYHTVDITCLAHYLVDAGKLPPGCQSTTQIIRHFKLRETASHTALNDALDMAKIYLKLLEIKG